MESNPLISVLISSTGQILKFDKKEILVGKDASCDMIWTQPYISRIHLKIANNSNQSYTVTDLHATNGTFVLDAEQGDTDWRKVPSGSECTVKQGAKIRVGYTEIQII